MRLSYFVRVPHQAHVALNRRAIFARDGHRCQYCGAQAENIDHILPRSKGGPHSWDNVVAACRRCNARKRDHLLEETGMKLRRPPAAPRGRVWALAALGAVLPDWEPYLGFPGQVVPLTVVGEGAAALVGLMRWEVQSASGTVSELHERSLALIASSAPEPFGPRRRAVVQNPVDRALVLGSSQPESSVDLDACAGARVDFVRRRSGGGAVLVEPGSVVWVDLYRHHQPALVRGRGPFDVVGWRGVGDALRNAGLGPLEVWKGSMVRNAWSAWVCFAGLGPGEVSAAGRKVVGISQRRTCHVALFQCACLVRWEPERLLELLAWPIEQLGAARRELAGAATGIGAERAELVVGDLLTALP